MDTRLLRAVAGLASFGWSMTVKSEVKPFNSSIEIALRAMFILDAFTETQLSVQQIVHFDYLMIHSGDVDNGPSSIHPPVPNRTGEWLLRRELLETALGMLIQRELAVLVCAKDGIYFKASELTRPFIKHFSGDYSKLLQERATWLKVSFGSFSETDLASYMTKHIATWGINDGKVNRGNIFG